MTNPAQSITTSATKNPQVLLRDDAAPSPVLAPLVINDFLKLSGGVPVTVFVNLYADSTTGVNTITFSLKGGPEFTQGILWGGITGYALMITFVLSPNIDELVAVTPSLWFSDTFQTGALISQACCVMPLFGEYHFGVAPAPSTGIIKLIDPKIIVTPINPTL